MPYVHLQKSSPRSVQILDTVYEAGVWKYVLHVQVDVMCTKSTHQYVVKRRYNEFKALYAAIKPVMQKCNLVPLPTSSIVDTMLTACVPSSKKSQIESRKCILEHLVNQIENHHVGHRMCEYQDFIAPMLHQQQFLRNNRPSSKSLCQVDRTKPTYLRRHSLGCVQTRKPQTTNLHQLVSSNI